MDFSNSDPIPIPIDLFVSKKHDAYKNGDLCFVDSNGSTIYKVNRRLSSESAKRVLRDAAGTPLVSMHTPHVSLPGFFYIFFKRKEIKFW